MDTHTTRQFQFRGLVGGGSSDNVSDVNDSSGGGGGEDTDGVPPVDDIIESNSSSSNDENVDVDVNVDETLIDDNAIEESTTPTTPTTPTITTTPTTTQAQFSNFVDDLFDEEVDLKKVSNSLKPRSSLHIKRKLVHAAWGLSFAVLLNKYEKKQFVVVGTGCSVFLFVVELLRYVKGFKWINNFFIKGFGGVLRKSEMEGRFTGVFYYFSGVTLAASFFR